MRLTSIPKFLIGNRRAIEEVAKSRDGLWIGLLLVLSAGFAREYDAEYLVKEPWHVLFPFAASLLASILFFSLVYGIGKRRGIGEVGFLQAFRSFLILFWMTAPLAWVYAIPFERFCEPVDATVANLWLLRIVSIWRVLLMARVVSVLFGCGPITAFFCVMLVADITMMTALSFASLPTISLMGGIRHNNSEAIISSAAFSTQVLGFLSMPVWMVGVAIIAMRKEPRWTVIDLTPSQRKASWPISVAICSVLVWILVLPSTQSEQRLRYEAEALLTSGRIAEGLTMMSQYEQDDFPPLWNPPPRPAFRIEKPEIPDVMLATLDNNCADWVKDVYLEKFRVWLGIGRKRVHFRWGGIEAKEVKKILLILEQIPEGPQYATEFFHDIEDARGDFGNELVDRAVRLMERN